MDRYQSAVSETGPSAWRVEVTGDVDLATAGRLADDLRPLAEHDAAELRLDLSGVEFIDSSGLRALVAAANTATEHGGSLALIGASSAVVRLIEIAGLSEHLAILAPD